MKSRYSIYFVLMFTLLLFPGQVFAKGRHVNIDNSRQSNIVVIGDSRIAYMSMVVKKYPKTKEKFSFNAVAGGHYTIRAQYNTGLYASTPLQINHPVYVREQKKIIKNCLKKHGKCNVVIEATINDASPTLMQESVERIEELRRTLKTIRVKYKGKYRKPTFYITSVVPPINNDDRVLWINNYLKQKYKKSYIYLGMNLTWFPYYLDGLHFTKEGSGLLYRKIGRAIKK